MKGIKAGNCEDRVLPLCEFRANDEVDCMMVGVLDGHGGSACVDYIQQQLPISVKGEFSSSSPIKASLPDIIQQNLRKAFHSADANFLYLAKRHNDNSGTTAAICVLYAPREDQPVYKVLLGGLGDSQAILYRTDPGTGRIIPVAANPIHRPGLASEKRRIESMGAEVINVQGIDRVVMRLKHTMIGLAVSRAFGDLLMKEPRHVVSSVPEFHDVQLDLSLDQFIVIGTDGIFDFVPVAQVGEILGSAPRTNAGMKVALEQIIAIARANGSCDDRTLVMVDFPWAQRRTDVENIPPFSNVQ